MIREETFKRAIEKIIKAEKEFKDGDFFKITEYGKAITIGCFKSMEDDWKSYAECMILNSHFRCCCTNGTVCCDAPMTVDFETMDVVKASPQEIMYAVNNLLLRGCYYDRRIKKVKYIK